MRRRVRWSKDLLTKESLFEKPYLSVGRAEMHMEMPSFVFPQFPPYPEYGPFPKIKYPPPYDRYVPRVWSYPPLPTKEGQQPTGSVSAFPTPKRTWPSPTSSVPPGNSWTGFRIVPYCNVDYYMGDCAEEGDVFIIRAQVQHYSGSLKWKAVSSNPGEVDVFLVSTHWGEAIFAVVVRKEITEEVSICITISLLKFKIDCGCIEIEGCDVCPADPTVSWDYGGSIETIARNASGTVAVLGGKGPYTWLVTGTGFSITSPTAGKSTTLSADGTACGMATITVTDDCGEETIGEVRGTTGSWVLQAGDLSCSLPGSKADLDTDVVSGDNYCQIGTMISGKKKMIVYHCWLDRIACAGDYGCSTEDCNNTCFTTSGCIFDATSKSWAQCCADANAAPNFSCDGIDSCITGWYDGRFGALIPGCPEVADYYGICGNGNYATALPLYYKYVYNYLWEC